MRYIADLHIHSCFSRATSKASRLPGLALWAAIKGIHVVGTGDFTHPGWLQHLDEYLEPAEPGFFRLKRWDPAEVATLIPEGLDLSALAVEEVRFVLSAEISSIYKKNGRVRKVHNLLFSPDLDAVRTINQVLAGIGNIESDGRPILGLDSRRLLEIFLEQCPEGFFVPAHIWTPWFSLFGSRSGFDALEECFDDLSSEIFALETGLSSDPAMNRCISSLDRYTLISNSDCHSPAKLGREANIFATGFDFHSMQAALRRPVDAEGSQVFAGTVEFYPEEGKYHNDGHRKCDVCFEPAETVAHEGLCPVCSRPLTVGVLHRVFELADRETPEFAPNAPAVHSLIPLPEMLGELLSVGPNSKKVMRAYAQVINTFGSEFNLLLDVPLSDIASAASPLLGEAVKRVREEKVIRRPGYDGAFGVIRVFDEDELARQAGQLSLFGEAPRKKRVRKPAPSPSIPVRAPKKRESTPQAATLNPEQEAAVRSTAPRILVQAGPGTGKTHTLVARLMHRLKVGQTSATVITFTNKAAEEIRQRLPREAVGTRVRVATLHAYCLEYLRRQTPDLGVAGPSLRRMLLRTIDPALAGREATRFAALLDTEETGALSPKDRERLTAYRELLAGRNLVDLDLVIPTALTLLREGGELARAMREETGELSIDEFQDLNRSQYELIMALAESSPVFAIGDPDQAIYGFRGADPGWFHRFIEEAGPECHRLRLNYRSDIRIIEAAGLVLTGKSTQEDRVVPVSRNPGRIQVHGTASFRREAGFVVRRIEELIGGSSHREVELLLGERSGEVSLADIGILYRTGRQAEPLAEALFKQSIPFQVVDLDPFYRSEPVRRVATWILLASGKADAADLLYLLGLERGIGKGTLARVEETLLVGQGDPLELLAGIPSAGARLGQVIAAFVDLGEEIRRIGVQDVVSAVQLVARRYEIGEEDPELQRFLQLAGAVGATLPSFAEYLLANAHSPVYDSRAEAVTLMTMHAAKGIEFPVVFLVGTTDDLCPLAPHHPLDEEAARHHFEEERRLFYVAMTRARHLLCMSWYEQSRERGEKKEPSRFLKSIPQDLLTPVVERKRKRRATGRQLRLF